MHAEEKARACVVEQAVVRTAVISLSEVGNDPRILCRGVTLSDTHFKWITLVPRLRTVGQ